MKEVMPVSYFDFQFIVKYLSAILLTLLIECALAVFSIKRLVLYFEVIFNIKLIFKAAVGL